MKYHLMIACLCSLPVGLLAPSAQPGIAKTIQSPLTAFSTFVFRNRLHTRAVLYRDREGAAEHACRNCFNQSPPQTEDVRMLTAEAPIEREISGGQTHSYQIALGAGDYLRIVITSRSAVLKSELFAPDSPKAVGIYRSTSGLRTVSLIAEFAGNHRLNIRPVSNDAATGRYELKIESLRPATEQDKIRIAAESAEWAGTQVKNAAPEKWQEAIAKFEEALTLWRQLNDRQGKLRMLVRLGGERLNIGEPQKAMNYFWEAFPLAQALGDRGQEANLLLCFGIVHSRQGEYQKALEAYDQARQAFASMSQREGEAAAIVNIGVVHQSLGDYQKSLECYEQALRTYSSLKLAGRQCNVLIKIGVAYSMTGQPQQAKESLNQAIAMARERRLTSCEGSALRHLGYVYLNLRDAEKALESFNEGLKLCRAMGDRVCEATALRGIASVSQLLGENEKALDYLGLALNKFHLSGERSREAVTLNQMAQVNQELGRLNEARQQVEQALDIMESARADVVSQQLRESFFVSAQSRFALYINLLMRLHQKYPAEGHDATALMANERARARGLLDLLTESRADLRQGVSPGLIELERSLQRQINAKAAARARLLDDDGAKAGASSLDKEISDLTSRYREVEAQIRAASPNYAALTQPRPLSAAEIQRQLLDENTVLLEFALGGKQSWLWAVTPQSLDSYSLPPLKEIETASRNVYELLTSRQPKKDLTESERQRLITEADARFTTEISTLSRMLLGPIASRLRQEWKDKRLVIVAPGALEYLPFAALPLPSENDYQPLIASHEVVNLPSASVLAALRRETAGRQPAEKTLAVIADPVFESNDPRALQAAKRKGSRDNLVASVQSAYEVPAASILTAGSDLARAAKSFNRAGFSRLPFSREEAETIAGLVPKNSLLIATGFQANRTMASSGALARYRIVHFATHGLLNSEHPELSGLVLSLVDDNGKTLDGFLRMHEIYNLRLPADIVVLSACQTALGKEVKGEGLVGLTRGFMYAGAQRVVASLWEVDDQATAQLMGHFYHGMLKENLRPAAALRAAQIEMSRCSRWSSPYYWAGFVIQGEWR
jgi:CHAT domain-containing protein/Tfp pilus assembly protein PilF